MEHPVWTLHAAEQLCLRLLCDGDVTRGAGRSLKAWLLPGPLAVLGRLWSIKRLRATPGEAVSSLLSYTPCSVGVGHPKD